MTLSARLLDYATVAVLVAVAVVVAFCADEAASWPGRTASVRSAWRWAARDTTTVVPYAGGTIRLTSTKRTALRLLKDVIGDL